MTLSELNEIKKNYKVLEIAVDFINPSYNISRAKHLDNSRFLICTLTENGIPRNVKEDEAARIRLQKPDRTYVYNDCDVLEDGRVFVTLTEQILAVEGNAVCDIQLTDEETGIIYSTKNFIINIDKTAVDNSIIASSDEFDALNNLIASNKKLNEELKENEAERIENETHRQENETDRQNSEIERSNAEAVRMENENNRIASENIREENEAVRQENETDRETNTAIAVSNAETAAKKANDAANDLQNKLDSHYFLLSEDKGSANGVAELDANGKVPANQLPSYVDDVIEGYFYGSKFYEETEHVTEITGETGKIYIDLHTNKTYRWSGSTFAVISETLALGETSSTAYRGDKGKIAYDHSQSPHAPSDAQANQNAFSNVTINSTTIAAKDKTDTLTLVAGDNITITPNTDSNAITISSTRGDSSNALPLSGGNMTGNIGYQGTKSTKDMIKFIDNTVDATGNGISIGGGGLTIIGGGESSDVIANQHSTDSSESMVIANDGGIDFYTNCQNGISSAKHITMNTDGSITTSGATISYGDTSQISFPLIIHQTDNANSTGWGGGIKFLNSSDSSSKWAGIAGYASSAYANLNGLKFYTNATNYISIVNNALIPATSQKADLGTDTNLWANVYANTFHGSLSGNASTATNADKLDGYHGSSEYSANTYILRDKNGHIFTGYINSNTSNNENPTISQIIVTNGTDHYYRKASLSHLKSALGTMPPSSHTHSYLPLSGGTMTGSPTIKCDGSFYIIPTNSVHIKLNNSSSTSNIYIRTNLSTNSSNGAVLFVQDSRTVVYGKMGIAVVANSASTQGVMRLTLGNNKVVGSSVDNARGAIRIYSPNSGYTELYNNSTSSNISIALPSSSGTLSVSSSDIRLKENIKDTDEDNALELVNAINFRQFDWKETGKHQKLGFIADELEKIDDHLVIEGTGGYSGTDENGKPIMNVKCVDTFYLIGYYGKAIQELSTICKAQELKIEELISLINIQSKEMEELKKQINNIS